MNCPKCNSTNLTQKENTTGSAVNYVDQYKCAECGHAWDTFLPDKGGSDPLSKDEKKEYVNYLLTQLTISMAEETESFPEYYGKKEIVKTLKFIADKLLTM